MNEIQEITLGKAIITLNVDPTNRSYEVGEYTSILANLPQNLNGSNPLSSHHQKDDPHTVESMIKDALAHKIHHIVETTYSDNTPLAGSAYQIPDYDHLEDIIPYDPNWPSALAGGDRRLMFLDSLYKENKLKKFSLGQAVMLFNELITTTLFKKSKGQHFIIILESDKFCYVSLYRNKEGRYMFAFTPSPHGLMSFGRNGHMVIT